MGSCAGQSYSQSKKINSKQSSAKENNQNKQMAIYNGKQKYGIDLCLFQNKVKFNHSPLESCSFLNQKFKNNDGSPTEVSLGYMIVKCEISASQKIVNFKYMNTTQMKVWLVCGGIEKISETGLTTEIVNCAHTNTLDIIEPSQNKNEGDLASFNLPENIIKDKKSNIILILEPQLPNQQTVFLVYRYQILPGGKQYSLITQSLHWSSLAFQINDVYGAESLFKVDNKDQLCSVCLTERCQTILMPCRHMCLCKGCSNKLQQTNSKKCPLCRNEYYAIIRYKINA